MPTTSTTDVVLREMGLRDGLQSIATFMPTAAKCAWISAEAAAGVREIEVTSFVPPKLLPQFADAEAVVAHALTVPGLTVAALIPNLRGAERGLALGVHKLNYVLSVSETHNMSNVRRSTQESVDDFRRIVAAVRAAPNRPRLCAGLATSFGCTFEGAIDEDRVRRIAVELAEAGADELALADTVGYGDPAAVRRLFAAVKRDVGDLPVGAHFHDTRGVGVANVMAALEVGVRAFDASLAGLGGCPFAPGATGNIVMEDTAFLCETLGYDTGVDIAALAKIRAILAENLPGTQLLGNVAKSGLPKHFVPARLRARREAAE
ncbi:MAG: hydroxymethylglutaryl-CoA lyase [Rhodospirillales bacterium 70-18]|nr:hydroxymethylglutaryl-CoA lyase [Rhodospirillales bacterium]OJY67288.1 MAG: hydroxymethylglutaryl-CoA lyase [Rhodospirillales bacterium 70-18]